MNQTIKALGRIHIIGIGGIGMSGIAEILHQAGCEVQGSDMGENANTARLNAQGIKTFKGHKAANIKDAATITYSSAVRADNPELAAARAQNLTTLNRASMLAAMMRANAITISGTHGKTTTTALIASILIAAELDPIVIAGGILNALGSNVRWGAGALMVVEADESDGTFTALPSMISVITNIEAEHLEHYGDYKNLRAAFAEYLAQVPDNGAAIVCFDDEEAKRLAQNATCPLVSYGFDKSAQIRASNYKPAGVQQSFDVETPDTTIKDITLPMAGKHNVQNALAAIAVARHLDIDAEIIRTALASFAGISRRLTHIAQCNGIDIYDDYAHHPTEIAATLAAAKDTLAAAEKSRAGRVIAVVQPHRYSRLSRLFQEFAACFADADEVLVLPVYAAGEAPIAGADAQALAAELPNALALEDDIALAATLAKRARAGDIVMCMGAGSISQMAQALPQQLQELAI